MIQKNGTMVTDENKSGDQSTSSKQKYGEYDGNKS